MMIATITICMTILKNLKGGLIMKFSIDKSTLSEALDIVLKSVSPKSTLKIIEGVLLEVEGKTLKITGNNLETAIRYEAECETLEPGRIVVEARKFAEIVKSMPDEELDLIAVEPKMRIEGGKTAVELPVIKADGFPEIKSVQAENFVELDQAFLKEMILKVAFAASEDDKKPTLKGVLVEIKDGIMKMVAVNIASLAIRTAKVQTADLKAIIPATTFIDVAKVMKSGKVSIHATETEIMFSTEKFIMTARLLDGEFFDYKKVYGIKSRTTLKVKVRDIIPALERIRILATGTKGLEASVLRIKDKFHITYKSANGIVDDEIASEIYGPSVKSGYDYRVVLSLLQSIEDTEVYMHFDSDIDSRIKIIPIDSEKFYYMCSPVVMRGE